MAFKSPSAVALNNSTSTAIYTFGSDQESVIIQNPSSNTITCYIGASGVTSGTGIELLPGTSISLRGLTNEVVHGIAASGTPSVRVLVEGG